MFICLPCILSKMSLISTDHSYKLYHTVRPSGSTRKMKNFILVLTSAECFTVIPFLQWFGCMWTPGNIVTYFTMPSLAWCLQLGLLVALSGAQTLANIITYSKVQELIARLQNWSEMQVLIFLKLHVIAQYSFTFLYNLFSGIILQCDFDGCNQQFTKCNQLKIHQFVHTSEKPFRWVHLKKNCSHFAPLYGWIAPS